MVSPCTPGTAHRLRWKSYSRGLAGRRVERSDPLAVRDVVVHPPGPESFDIIIVTRFLERDLAPQLARALRIDGLLFYQTFTRTRVSDAGPGNLDYRLADGELLVLFSTLQVLVYREEGKVGDISRGFRDEAMMIARKRAS